MSLKLNQIIFNNKKYIFLTPESHFRKLEKIFSQYMSKSGSTTLKFVILMERVKLKTNWTELISKCTSILKFSQNITMNIIFNKLY